MATLSWLMLFAGALLYAASAVMFFVDATRKGGPRGPLASTPAAPRPTAASRFGLAPTLLAAAAVLHLGYITVASFVAHTCPVGSVHFILSVVAIAAAGAFTLARVTRRGLANIDALGVVVAPFGLAFLLGTYFLDKPSVSSALGPGFIALHVLVNLVGVALFVLAGAAATLYLVQERRLKHKKLRHIGGLPPLDTLDRAVHRFLVLGFPLLTIGVISGTFFAYQLESGSFDEIMRIVLGYTTWLLIAAVLLLRTAAGWRGRRSAYGTLLGLLCALSVLVVYIFRPDPTPRHTHAQPVDARASTPPRS